jgi:hypothetical protein
MPPLSHLTTCTPTTSNKKLYSSQGCSVVWYNFLIFRIVEYCILEMETPNSSKVVVNFYQTTQCHIPYASNLHCQHHKNHKPHTLLR